VSISPTVGLQQPVPLLGSYSGAGIAAGFFACMFLRPFGKRSVVAAVLFLPAIAVQQSRGMIIAVPLAMVVIFFASGRLAGRLRLTTTMVVVMGAISLALTFAASPEGRLGPTNANHIIAELETLTGGRGPGEGTYNHRRQWLSSVMARVDEHPLGWAIGLGLGPDLANGFQPTAILVRKPHNDYLEAYARLGLLGLVPFVLLLVTAIVPVFRAARHRSGAAGDFLWWVVAVSIVYSFIAATQPLFAYAFGTVPLFAALGAALALVNGSGADDAST
jgi:O-antigen ligase